MLPPKLFFERMQNIGCNVDELMQAYSMPPKHSIRINTLKLPLDKTSMLGLKLSPVPFSPLGFIIEEDIKAGSLPWHHAGAYYVQEPSAMSAVTALDPQPGEYVLDMCAAPGGKTTQIAELMNNEGLLWSNEFVRSRAQPLISNIERMGVTNAVVSSLHPDAIAEAFPEAFDRVLVDAPCSGEGMFRKDNFAIQEWSVEHVCSCAQRQAAILESAAKCLRPGGVLVYSTCTFSPEENEKNIIAFLENHPDFSLEKIPAEFGRSGLNLSDAYDLTLTRRVYPMDGGEGHFVARMRRQGEINSCRAEAYDEDYPQPAAELLSSCFSYYHKGKIKEAGEGVYLVPPAFSSFDALPVLRAGVLIGTKKKGRIEPEHAMFMAANENMCKNVLHLPPESRELAAFLHGETVESEKCASGYCAVACGGIITGFGKCSNCVVKNHYPKGLRVL